jgi:hypothetical protein
MKAKKISNPYRKGNQYACKMQVKLFLSLALLFAIVFVVGMFLDPDHSMFCMTGFSGTSLASMMAIGNVEDVSDKNTHGSNIAYKIYLIDVHQINPDVKFPRANANREVATLPMLPGEYMKYFEAHDIPTYVGNGEKGDITTSGTNQFVAIMGGMRDQLLNFIEEHAGGKFVILFKEIGEDQWYVLGEYDRPMVLKSYEAKNDKDGRYITFTFERTSVTQYYKYVGDIVKAPAEVHTAGTKDLAVKSTSNSYEIPNGAAATYAIETVSGLTNNDKGRHITLTGTGTDKAATIADGATFILEDGVTWTAKAGSSITFRILDPATLIEVSGSRIQTA